MKHQPGKFTGNAQIVCHSSRYLKHSGRGIMQGLQSIPLCTPQQFGGCISHNFPRVLQQLSGQTAIWVLYIKWGIILSGLSTVRIIVILNRSPHKTCIRFFFTQWSKKRMPLLCKSKNPLGSFYLKTGVSPEIRDSRIDTTWPFRSCIIFSAYTRKPKGIKFHHKWALFSLWRYSNIVVRGPFFDQEV